MDKTSLQRALQQTGLGHFKHEDLFRILDVLMRGGAHLTSQQQEIYNALRPKVTENTVRTSPRL